MLRRKRRRAGGALEELEASGRVPLACRGCAERVVLLGREDDWREEGRPTFACGGCGTVLTFADRVGRRAQARRDRRAAREQVIGAGT